MIDLQLRQAYALNDPNLQGMLEKLQGNILRSHGRNHTVNLFLKFTDGAEKTRQILQPLLSRIVTPAARQRDESLKHRQALAAGRKGDSLFGNFFLSRKGYNALGFADQQIRQALPSRTSSGIKSNFFDGMEQHASELNDPAPDPQWHNELSDVDALLLLAHSSNKRLQDAAKTLTTVLADMVVAREDGHAYRAADGTAFEHFGFSDSMSQPVFFDDQIGNIDRTIWDPLEPLGLVLVRDGAVPNDQEAFGSFYVFRKLEQNVRAFRSRERSLANELQQRGIAITPTQVGAMAVGRFRDGTPLALSAQPGANLSNPNEFNFRGDRLGGLCPLHAHIRKVNPRGTIAEVTGTGEDTVERPRRIVRRGIPYGQRKGKAGRTPESNDLPENGVGLLFASFQASIPDQFAFIQSWWSNRTDHPGGSGIDPLIGGGGPGVLDRWGPTQQDRADFGHFVRFKSGEFFFAPSIPFLRVLAPPPAATP